MGTILLPLMGFPLGWAKPVPVSPQRFTRKISMGLGDTLVSMAGPAANLALGLFAAIALGILWRFSPDSVEPGRGVFELLWGLMRVNAGLMVFNLLPLPPLDGGHVAAALVPYKYRGAWDRFATFSPLLLLAIVFLGFSRFLVPPIELVLSLLRGVTQLIA
jgi:Zn-dependent protease